MTEPTDTNQASEDELDNILDNIFWLGYKFAIDKLDKTPNEYLAETIEAIAAIIRTEKLKLLAEVRERVIEQAKPDKRKANSWQQGIEVAAYEDAVRVYEYKMNEQLTKLEAEL